MLLCVAGLMTSAACSDDGGTDRVFASTLTPEFTFSSDDEIIAGISTVRFTNQTKVEGTSVAEYFWHFGFSGEGNWSEAETPDPVQFKEPGEYMVKLTVWGADGNKATVVHPITVLADNLAPMASFEYAPADVVLNEPVTFSDRSSDSDGEIVKRTWIFPDKQIENQSSVEYTFTQSGNFNVTLKVEDDRGASAEMTQTIYVWDGTSLGSGTENDPWVIRTVEHWNKIARSMNAADGEYAADAYYVLMTDVDFTGQEFVAWRSFLGHLNGNGHKLTGIKATHENFGDPTSEEASFGVIAINNGEIKNLSVEANFTSLGDGLGGVVGINNGIIDGASFKGSLNGGKRMGGITGINNMIILNCANLGGSIISSSEATGGLVGVCKNAGFVINCYSWVDIVSSKDTNAGGIIGYGGSDSFAINCYSTTANISSGTDHISAIGYIKKSNLQNIYGNAVFSSAVGSVKNDGSNAPSVWPTPTTAVLSLDQMISGEVTVPSSNAKKASFVEALNAGVDIYNSASFEQKPEGLVLRRWKASNTYPVLE